MPGGPTSRRSCRISPTTSCSAPRSDPSRDRPTSEAAAREGFQRMFSHDADWTPIPNEIHGFGDRVVLLWGYRREVDGTTVVIRGCDLFTFRDRLIVRKDAFRKVLG